jgi:cytochrome c-type protein NapB
MISVTHYMNRDGNFLAEVSPRRYFCIQCHVTQTVTRDVLENDFKDMDELLEERAAREEKE